MTKVVLEDRMTQIRKDAKEWWSKVVLDEHNREKKIPIGAEEARRLGQFLHMNKSIAVEKSLDETADDQIIGGNYRDAGRENATNIRPA